MSENQEFLFDPDDYTVQAAEWQGMPEFSHKDLEPCKQLIVNFEQPEDVQRFAAVIGQRILAGTRSIWFPEVTIERYKDKRYNDEPGLPGVCDQQGALGVAPDEQGAGSDRCAVQDSSGATGVPNVRRTD